MPDTLYDLTRDERRAAVKAFRRLPLEARREVVRRANQGQRHPDPTVDEVTRQWSRAVLRRAWWNRLPGWVQPAACAALMLTGWWLGSGAAFVPEDDILFLILVLGGGIALVIGLLEWSTRTTAQLILKAATLNNSAAPEHPGD
ncbi:hypothetical protein [Actinoplanes xinjiangensis]|nr:hypothetical protein [Actinoplanes xinjiangensis]